MGGRLYLDGRQLRFRPHRFDRARAAREWSAELDAVSSVTVVPRRPFARLFGAGMRRQLRIEADGQAALFIVNGADRAAAELRALIVINRP